MTGTDRLVVGVGGHAVGIDAGTGTELWRTKLKGAGTVTVSMAGTRAFAATSGELFCLDAWTGSILWHNKLKGLGMGIVSLPGSDAVAAAARAAAGRQAAGAG
jgi:outer membrane protein assembly factor BamB